MRLSYLFDPSKVLERWGRRKFAPRKPRTVTGPAPIVRLPEDHREAAQRLVDLPYMKSAAFKWRRDEIEWDILPAPLADFMRHFLKALDAYGIPMIVTETWRSPDRQNQLRALGRSNASGGSSPHQWGCAFDLVHAVRGWQLDRKEWDVIIQIGMEVARKRKFKVRNGSTFKSLYDPAHWEVLEWQKVRAAIRADHDFDRSPPAWARVWYAAFEKRPGA